MNFNIYYKATVIKTVCWHYRAKDTDQQKITDFR